VTSNADIGLLGLTQHANEHFSVTNNADIGPFAPDSVALKIAFDLNDPRPTRSVTTIHGFLQLIALLLIDWLRATLVTSDTADATTASLTCGQN
jgi:hypothetical protein